MYIWLFGQLETQTILQYIAATAVAENDVNTKCIQLYSATGYQTRFVLSWKLYCTTQTVCATILLISAFVSSTTSLIHCEHENYIIFAYGKKILYHMIPTLLRNKILSFVLYKCIISVEQSVSLRVEPNLSFNDTQINAFQRKLVVCFHLVNLVYVQCLFSDYNVRTIPLFSCKRRCNETVLRALELFVVFNQ